ncbi:MAG: hypothetical protein B6245_16125 [Desulfobacteraceae bacterium 4572_88]|nr:MAG: hypothetical protein B6245_16125 [Desulfobacteraceae bacterium 4572_88]
MNNGNRLPQHPSAFSRGIYPSAWGFFPTAGAEISKIPESGFGQAAEVGWVERSETHHCCLNPDFQDERIARISVSSDPRESFCSWAKPKSEKSLNPGSEN